MCQDKGGRADSAHRDAESGRGQVCGRARECYFGRGARRARVRLERRAVGARDQSVQRMAERPLTEGRIERKTAICVDEGKDTRLRGRGRSQDTNFRPVEAKRVSSAAGRRDAHGHILRRAHDPKTANTVAADDLATNVVEVPMKRETTETRNGLLCILAPYEASSDSDTARPTGRVDRSNRDVGVVFGRGHENDEETRTVRY